MRLAEVKKGGLDQRGRKVLDVFWSTKEYVIFLHPQGVSPHFSDDAAVAGRQREAYGEIAEALSAVNALRSGAIWRGSSIDREIARAISQALDGNVDNANLILSAVRDRLRNLRTIRGRLEYQLAAFSVALLAVGSLGLVLLWPGVPEGNLFSPLRLSQVACCGALGGFLSISIGIRKLDVDPDADWRINGISGASRIIIAMIASIFVYFAVVSGLILGNLSIESSNSGIFAISIAAGFSEFFVPNILRQITQNDTPLRDEGVRK